MAYDYDNFDEYDDGIDIYDELDLDVISNSIQDGVDLEKLLIAISKSRAEVEFLKKLKAKRLEPIDAKIGKLQNNEEKLRDFILELMPHHFPKQNTVDFPGVGKISKRKNKGKWVVTDEDAFSEVLKKHNLYDEVMKVKASVDKKKVPSAVSRILASSNEEKLNGVEFQEPECDNALVIRLYGEKDETESESDLGF